MADCELGDGGSAMAGQPGFFDSDERLKALSAAGDPLERLAQVIDFEEFRGDLKAALSRSDRTKGGRPPYDAVLMFKVLVLQTLYTLSDDQTEYQLKDRLSFMRFVGPALHDPVPDAKTIWLYREQLARAGAAETLFARFDALLRAKGWLAMGGQIVDATVIQARRPRLTQAEKDTIKGGGVPAEWKPTRRAQIDRDRRWTIKRGRKREAAPGDGHKRLHQAVTVQELRNRPTSSMKARLRSNLAQSSGCRAAWRRSRHEPGKSCSADAHLKSPDARHDCRRHSDVAASTSMALACGTERWPVTTAADFRFPRGEAKVGFGAILRIRRSPEIGSLAAKPDLYAAAGERASFELCR
jgi:IS5 family transposase